MKLKSFTKHQTLIMMEVEVNSSQVESDACVEEECEIERIGLLSSLADVNHIFCYFSQTMAVSLTDYNAINSKSNFQFLLVW